MSMDSLVFFLPEIIKHEFVQIICGHLFFSFQMLFFSHRPGSNSFLETALPVLSPTPAPVSHGEAQWRMLLISPLLLYIYIWGMWTWIGIFSLWRETGSSNVEEAAFSQVLVQCALGHFGLREQAHSQGPV